ncbi:MAG: hypothetical protein IJH61_06065, partial [Eubacteriaceae bacterium]|nr:hypothetical protein [Eubacteriaceae bacterium]
NEPKVSFLGIMSNEPKAARHQRGKTNGRDTYHTQSRRNSTLLSKDGDAARTKRLQNRLIRPKGHHIFKFTPNLGLDSLGF